VLGVAFSSSAARAIEVRNTLHREVRVSGFRGLHQVRILGTSGAHHHGLIITGCAPSPCHPPSPSTPGGMEVEETV
jgi:hypothetical protein